MTQGKKKPERTGVVQLPRTRPDNMETAFQAPRNFFESLRGCVAYLERCKADPGMSKDDVIDGIEERVSVMMGKVLSEPTATSFCVFRMDEEEQA